MVIVFALLQELFDFEVVSMEMWKYRYVPWGVIVVSLVATASGQLFESPSMRYKNMTMDADVRLRGGFDLTHCAKHLMNCWDIIIKPEVVCYEWMYYDNICTMMRHFGCYDQHEFGFNDPPRIGFTFQSPQCDWSRSDIAYAESPTL